MNEFEDILKGCRTNDRNSQEKLYRQFYPAMYALCKKFFHDPHDIQTSLNNGMMRVFKNIGQFDHDKGLFFNWMYTIVRNTCLTALRNTKTDHTVEFNEDIPDETADIGNDASDWDDLYEKLDALPKMTRAVCSLFYIEGFLIKEIAEDLNMKEGTVRWHLNQSRTRLKALLEKKKQSNIGR